MNDNKSTPHQHTTNEGEENIIEFPGRAMGLTDPLDGIAMAIHHVGPLTPISLAEVKALTIRTAIDATFDEVVEASAVAELNQLAERFADGDD
jgi:hypothetical protein